MFYVRKQKEVNFRVKKKIDGLSPRHTVVYEVCKHLFTQVTMGSNTRIEVFGHTFRQTKVENIVSHTCTLWVPILIAGFRLCWLQRQRYRKLKSLQLI